jgi:hypothetical protein
MAFCCFTLGLFWGRTLLVVDERGVPRLRVLAAIAAMGAPVSGTYAQPWEGRVVWEMGSSVIRGMIAVGVRTDSGKCLE